MVDLPISWLHTVDVNVFFIKTHISFIYVYVPFNDLSDFLTLFYLTYVLPLKMII